MKKFLFFTLIGFCFLLYESWFQLVDKSLLNRGASHFLKDVTFKITGKVKKPSWGEIKISEFNLFNKDYQLIFSNFYSYWNYSKIWNNIISIVLKSEIEGKFYFHHKYSQLDTFLKLKMEQDLSHSSYYFKGVAKVKKFNSSFIKKEFLPYLELPLDLKWEVTVFPKKRLLKIKSISAEGKNLSLKVVGAIKGSYFDGTINLFRPFTYKKTLHIPVKKLFSSF